MDTTAAELLKKILPFVLIACIALGFITLLTTVIPLGESLNEMRRWAGSGGHSSEMDEVRTLIGAAWLEFIISSVLCFVSYLFLRAFADLVLGVSVLVDRK